jgi:hypothetical protein
MYSRVKNSKYPGSSALGLLPPLKCSDNFNDTAVNGSIKRAVEEIGKNLRWYLGHNEDNTVRELSGRFPPQIPGLKLNFEQANKVIHHLNFEFKLIGALHIPSINSILFQTSFGSFSLEYGSKAFRSESGCYILHHEFDKDCGFVPLNEVIPGSEEEYIQKVTKVLQEYYTKWCLNNRNGFIIPDAQNCILSDSKKTESSYWKYGKCAGAVLLMAGLFAYRLYKDGAIAAGDINEFIPKI